MQPDRGPEFDGVRVGRPAAGALIDAGYAGLADLPDDLDELLALHGVGPRAVRLLREAQVESSDGGYSRAGSTQNSLPDGSV